LLDALIVGGDSFIGAALLERLSRRAESTAVIGTTRRRGSSKLYFLDLRVPIPVPPARVTYLLAGITKFKQIESDLHAAARVNITGNIAVASYQRRRGGRIVFMSSSSTEHEPMHEHGMLKFAAEIALVSAFGDDVAIVRCGPIVKPGRECYPDRDYMPVTLDALVGYLSAFLVNPWRGGLHRLVNSGNVVAETGRGSTKAELREFAPRYFWNQ